MSENTKIDVLEAIGTAAAKEAENIIASAETYAEERRSAAMQNAYELGEAEEKKANERADDILKKRATAARMERNKIILDAKRKAVDRVYELLLDGLKKLNEDEFVNLVSIAVEKYGEDGQKILLSASAPAKKEKIESLAALRRLFRRRSRTNRKLKVSMNFILKLRRRKKTLMYKSIFSRCNSRLNLIDPEKEDMRLCWNI